MTFDAKERSEYDGEPRELYWFMRGSQSWFYTSSALDITFQDHVFEAAPGLSRSNIKEGDGEASARQLTVTVPRNNLVAEQFIGVPHIQPVWLYIYRLHAGETDYRITWQGRVRYAEFKSAQATLTLDNILSSTKKNALRHLYQGQCNHFTFDLNCGLSEVDYTRTTVVDAISANLITVNSPEAANYYVAGQVRRLNGDRRFVTKDTLLGFGNRTLELITPFEDLDTEEEVLVIGGACLHTFDTCPDSVKANYGGFPKVPRKNPFRSFK